MAGSPQQRRLLGQELTVQAVALAVSVVVVALLVGLAVLNWLERVA